MPEETVKLNSGRKLFFGLFVFPLVIAVGMAMILCAVVFMTSEQETPETLIAAIKTGSPGKRWQKAFELSNEINHNKQAVQNENVMRGIIHILEDRTHYDPKTRAYMAIALSHFNNPEASKTLSESLNDPDKDIQLYSLWALGNLKVKSAASSVAPFLQNEDADLRSVASYVLGVIGDRDSVTALKTKLTDASADVKWNAALALARLGDGSGAEVLSSMLDRQKLEKDYGMGENEIEKVMINAAKGLALLKDPKSNAVLEMVSKNEKNLRVRQAAITAVDYRKQIGAGKTLNPALSENNLVMENIAS